MMKKMIISVATVVLTMSLSPAFSEQTGDTATTQTHVKKHHTPCHTNITPEKRDQWRKDEREKMKTMKTHTQ